LAKNIITSAALSVSANTLFLRMS